MFDTGGPQFGIEDCKIGISNLDGTYETPVDVPSIQLYGVTMNVTQADLEGDDKITSSQAKAIAAQVVMRFGSVHLAVLEVILGRSIQSSGGEAARWIKVTNERMPWFGVCGRADAAEGSGDTHIFVPKLKVSADFEIRFEYNGFTIPELTCRAIADGSFVGSDTIPAIFYPLMHNAVTVVALPPAALGGEVV